MNNLKQDKLRRVRLRIEGRVQGVGFRPTVFRLAGRFALTGFVRNTSFGVLVEAQGGASAVRDFVAQLQSARPRQAVIESLQLEETSPIAGETRFTITESRRSGDVRAGMPPDLALCEPCKRELFNAANRRHRYPFINCTDCGPRFTIIRGLPYDRKLTTMERFKMCSDCRTEFVDPINRRFDAQPNACPVCGPNVTLLDNRGKKIAGDPIKETIKMLMAGKIMAVKGIGGYHICCDALNTGAIALLRKRKRRPDKPFAVMFNSLEQVKKYCLFSPAEAAELTEVAAPVVILQKKAESALLPILSPDSNDIGAFLPYSPLHCLLLAECSPLVMTSGNRGDEPIAINEDDLKRILGHIADAALVHNRQIARRCDDSVLKTYSAGKIIMRRSRGYVPEPIGLPVSGPSILACGAEVKNTVCLTRGNRAFLSAHIGDLDDFRNYRFFEETVRDFMELLEIKPEFIAHDLHPDYVSTRYALAFKGARPVGVQHHHAHIASCLAEHKISEKVIGIALDGTGYGPDGTIWGGELLITDLHSFQRVGHFKQYPLPGGRQAILEPARMALSCLLTELGDDGAEPVIARRLTSIPARERILLIEMVKRRLHSPLTSSAGRLFDAIAALLGFGGEVSYEGQAAVRLQTLADKNVDRHYSYGLKEENGILIVSFAGAIREIVADLDRNIAGSLIAGMFHNTMAAVLADACLSIRTREKLNRVAMSGGVFQNEFLLEKLIYRLKKNGFEVYTNNLVPPNDGGIAFGQAAVAAANNLEP